MKVIIHSPLRYLLQTVLDLIRSWRKPKKEESDMQEILNEMLSNYGMQEVAGGESNPEILAMFDELGYDWVTDDSTTAWCSAALNYFCKKLGYERSGDLIARSWLKLPVYVLKPTMGDIIVLWRESEESWKGHVGIFISEDKERKRVYILGGNVNDMISIASYSSERILGYRKLRKLTEIKE